ncbi:MAG: multidrug efflux RND transporter permease subunit [Lentisphaeria bacterium]|nr:multidrug efflux RND transporter permease subunit [Lentisphaeria bacterium]
MISQFFISRPRFAFVISILFIISGTIAMFALPIAQYPNIVPPQVQVTASYPGASAEVVEKTVVNPIESQVNGVKDMIYMTSSSANDGSATITVTFEIGTSGDLNTVNTQNRVALATATLPDEVTRSGVDVKEMSPNMLMVVNLISPDESLDNLFLSNYALINIRDRLLRVNGVGDVALFGGFDYSMRVWLDPNRLSSFNMAATDVINAIQEQNLQVAAGQVGASPSRDSQQFQYTIQTQGRLETVEEFQDIIIRAENDGSYVRVKDVARVELGAESYTQFSTLNDKAGVMLVVYQLPSANALEVADEVRASMADIEQYFPDGLKYDILYDTTKFVKLSIHEVVVTLFIAVVLVILVVYLFLQEVRSTVIPSITIPVSLIGTFAVMLALGYTINTISLFGLILAIGIVVDDAILVIENVSRLMETKGMSPKEAARESMKEITSPIISTTLVLLSVFVPVAFIPGITGILFRQFAVTISISVCISSINALTLSPALCACFLKPVNSEKKKFFIFEWFNATITKSTKWYGDFVGFLCKRLIIPLLMFGGVLGSMYWLYGEIPTAFIPNEDQGYLFVDVKLPDAASIERTQQVVQKSVSSIKDIPGISDIMTVNGYSLLSGAVSSNAGFMIVMLDDWGEREEPSLSLKSILMQMREKLNAIPDAQLNPFPPPPIQGLGTAGGFEYILQDTQSRPPSEMEKVMNGFIMNANQDNDLAAVFSLFRSGVPQVYLNIDRDKVKKLGISMSELFTTLQAQLGSYYVNDFNKFGKVYRVTIMAEEPYRNSIDDILKLFVRNKDGEMVQLNTLLTIDHKLGPDVITHYNLFRSVTINGSAAPGKSSGQAMAAMERLSDEKLPNGYQYEWTGTSYQEKIAGGKTIYVFALCITFVYLFLVAQYESWAIPIAVMLSIPIAILGALLMVFLMKLTNDIYVQVGIVLLFGMATKTAILIVEFSKELRESGRSIVEAAEEASRLRFRAVLMTAISFVLGVLPLVLASGAGAASRVSLGSAVCGGMVMACILGTPLVPTFFVMIQRMREWVNGGEIPMIDDKKEDTENL